MKKFVQQWLAGLAKLIITKHKPKVIGITGSVGKTSTRDAIYAVVSTAFSVRKGQRNFNNEFGLPFAILGVDTPGRNPVKWLWVFAKGYLMLWFGVSVPQVMVLEMGVDKPGDMDYLVNIARPDIAVVTNIGVSHYEFFKTQEAVAAEKGKIVEALADNGFAVLNNDNELAKAQAGKTQARSISYGFRDDSDVRIRIIEEDFNPPSHTKIEVVTHYNSFEATVAGVGTPHLSAIAAGIAVGLNLNIPQEDIIKGIKTYRPVVGRLNILAGIKKDCDY
ncbi:hypothetical protein IPM19_03280 [bacterium]|nr:MAG: hypothetical protein IPM19_03280 [bacterium]